jgi:trehalose 6-phosphate phosphatase
MPRLPQLWHALEHLAARLEPRPHLFIGCDFDGTLVGIRERPEDVTLDDRTRETLDRLRRLEAVHVAILSGRTLDDLAARVGMPGVYLAGAGGLESQDETGRRASHVTPDRLAPPELVRDLAIWCRRFPGAWIEEKGPAFAVHYRAVAPTLQPAFGAGLRRRVRPFSGRVQLMHGKKVFDVLPSGSDGKAGALRRWLARHPGQDPLLFYFGDDRNDEEAYVAARALGGVTTAVGRLATRAQYGLPSPRSVGWFLEWLLHERVAIAFVGAPQ